MRIDKWLWAVRIFKTRSQASESCKKGKVMINDVQTKPSREVNVNDIVNVKKPPAIFTYKVTGILQKRSSAKIASEHYEDLTPEEEINKIKIKNKNKNMFAYKGEGRPTKKQRRKLDEFKNIQYY
jgi:ribosome-associated heat shock protein Hsp15